jgi:YVTN family beta-propeller protein
MLPDGIGDDPVAIAGNPKTGLVYVVNEGSDDVSVISGTRSVASIYAWDRPHRIAVNPETGYSYVLNKTEPYVRIITGTRHVKSIFIEGAWLSHVATDPIRGHVYVTHGNDEVTIIRRTEAITTVRLRDTLLHSDRPVAVNPTTGLAYVVSLDETTSSSTVFVLSGTEHIGSVPLEGHGRGIAADSASGYVYINDVGEDTVHVLSATQGIGTVSVGEYPAHIAVESGSGLAYVSCRDVSSIHVLHGDEVVDVLDVSPYHPGALEVDPVSGYLYAVLQKPGEERWDYVVVVEGTTQLALLKIPRAARQLGTDGKGGVYIAHRPGDFLTVLQGTEVLGGVPSRASPSVILSDPDTGYTYIANGTGSDTVSVLNGTEVVTHVNIGCGPILLERQADTNLTYAACGDEPAFAILQGEQLLTKTTVPTISHPIWTRPEMAVDAHRGWVYYTFGEATEIVVFSQTQMIGTISLTHKVYDLAVDPTTRHLLVAGPNPSLTVISGTGVISQIAMPDSAYRLTVSPRSGYVYAQSSFELQVVHRGRWVRSFEWILPNHVAESPFTGHFLGGTGYPKPGPRLAVISGSTMLKDTHVDLPCLDGVNGDVSSDRVYLLCGYGWGYYPHSFQVWRELAPIGGVAKIGWVDRIGASPGGEFVYMTEQRGPIAHHVRVYREIYLTPRFYLPLVLRGW